MKVIRVLSILIFLAVTVVFAKFKVEEWNSEDYVGPEITMESDSILIPCDTEKTELLDGVSAIDAKDGDVSETLIVESMSNFIEKGRRVITIAAFDSNNNISKVTREVVYSDYQSPHFALEEPLRFPMNTQDILDPLSAYDVLDGDLTSRIKMSTDYYVQVDTAGIYPMVFSVSNSAGDVVKLPVNIEIYDTAAEYGKPQIELSDYLIYTSIDTPIEPWNYVESVSVGNKIFERGEDGVLHDTETSESKKEEKTAIFSSEFEIENSIDYSTAGVYEVIYHYDASEEDEVKEEEQDKYTGTVRLIVIVSE